MKCYICLSSEGELLSNICNCKGSTNYIHKKCLFKSLKTFGINCTICKAKYNLFFIFLYKSFIDTIKRYIIFNIINHLINFILNYFNPDYFKIINIILTDPRIVKYKNYKFIKTNNLYHSIRINSLINFSSYINLELNPKINIMFIIIYLLVDLYFYYFSIDYKFIIFYIIHQINNISFVFLNTYYKNFINFLKE